MCDVMWAGRHPSKKQQILVIRWTVVNVLSQVYILKHMPELNLKPLVDKSLFWPLRWSVPQMPSESWQEQLNELKALLQC